MSLTVQYLAKQLNLPLNQLILQLNRTGIQRKLNPDTELTEEELMQLYKELQSAKTEGTKPSHREKDTTEPLNENAMDKRSLQYMDYMISQSEAIFIDTSSLLQPISEEFLKRLAFHLEKHGKKLILPFKVYEELKKHQNNENNSELAKMATQTLRRLALLQQKGHLDIYGDQSLDNFADNVFNTQITRLRVTHAILLITNDIKLGQDILLLNQSQSVRGKKVHVQKVDRFGFLQRVRADGETVQKPHVQSEKAGVTEKEKFKLATKITPVSDQTMHINKLPEAGDYVQTDKKRRVHLRKQLGSGGEGTVYATDDKNVVAKIYKREKVTVEKHEKLKLMVSKPIQKEGICYPIDILYNEYNEFIGYTMPKAEGKELKHFLFIPKKVFENRHPNWTRKDLVKLSLTILEKIDYLQKRNIILGDINPFNILVVSPEEVYLVDVDSNQVEGFPCPVGTDNYTAPEIQGKNFKDFLRTFGNEYFAVATLVFSILFLGKSPYSQTGGDTNAENIKSMDFPYTYGQEERAENTPKGQWRYIWSNLPYRVKKAFYQTFQKGQPHANESDRLKTEDWIQIMKKYFSDLDSGRLVQQDEIANDVFPSRFKMIGDSKQNLQNCILCDQSYQKWQLTKNICRGCLNKGEEYGCARCGKEMIFTNFEKHVKHMKKGFEHCKDCNAHYNSEFKSIQCSDCRTYFSLTYRDKEFYDQRGYNYPKRCLDCRRSNKTTSHIHKDYSQPETESRSSQSTRSSRRWCFLTTVACEYYDLADNCYELETLRSYRDNWLNAQTDGPSIIKQYYEDAPTIVKYIKQSEQYEELCIMIMRQYIQPCIQLIENSQYQECKNLYIEMFNHLKQRTTQGE
ncbi:CFI-box-CTERM domain-containing protein [Bacillus niameyensis]|uniref:CFI-box-CTERM domain-containing protein n=1 Tax=Bacillus niameyensis TaxID=1522308 RepID=UPI000781D3A7|nr:CFI-box-CTERM domain-containing protein [Bacillus niameyensis]